MVFVLSFSACAPSEPTQPTMDVTEIVQQVAATLQMGYTQTAQAMPTATDTPAATIKEFLSSIENRNSTIETHFSMLAWQIWLVTAPARVPS